MEETAENLSEGADRDCAALGAEEGAGRRGDEKRKRRWREKYEEDEIEATFLCVSQRYS